MGNYVPAVPSCMDSAAAIELIRRTRTLPAAIRVNGVWTDLFLPIDKRPDGSWRASEEAVFAWRELYAFDFGIIEAA